MAERQADNHPKGGAAPLPPVTSGPNAIAGRMAAARELAPPFVSRMPSLTTTPEPDTPFEPHPVDVEPPAAELPADGPQEVSSPEVEMQWEQDAGDEEGTVEPMFEADVSETEATIAAMSPPSEFPLDAFIIPEESQRVPTGLEGMPIPEPPPVTPVSELADRLEKFSHRLRVEDTDEVIARLAAGDKLDALLAGYLAGLSAGAK